MNINIPHQTSYVNSIASSSNIPVTSSPSSSRYSKSHLLMSHPIINNASADCWTRKFNTSSAVAADGMTELPDDFSPSSFDVICSRGKVAKNHPGNIYFQSLIQQNVDKYANAKDKMTKTIIVSEIIDNIRERTTIDGTFIGGGPFVKKQTGGRSSWFDIGEVNARERVGQNLRDQLKGKYRSSATSKRKKREAKTAQMVKELDNFHASDSYASKRIKCLTDTLLIREGSRGTTGTMSFPPCPQQSPMERSDSSSSSSSSSCSSGSTSSSSIISNEEGSSSIMMDDSNILLMMTEANCDILRQVSSSRNNEFSSMRIGQ